MQRIEINKRVRSDDEWFDEPDELDRVEAAPQSIDLFDDPVAAASAIAFRITRAQGFTEGNKRTALLLARWTTFGKAEVAEAIDTANAIRAACASVL